MNRQELKQVIDTNITNQIRDDSITPYSLGAVLDLMIDNLALVVEVPDPGPTPVTDIKPQQFGISVADGYDRIPLSSLDRQSWQSGGLVVAATYSSVANHPLSNSVVKRVNGKIKAAPGVDQDDVILKSQLDEAVFASGLQPDNVGPSTIANSPQSMILKSRESTIILSANSGNRQNMIIGGSSSTITGQQQRTLILASANVQMGGFGNNQAIIASRQSSITASVGAQGLAIIASDQCNIYSGRVQTAIIASTEATIEAWADTSLIKWNSAVIASRGSIIQSSNSYALATGKLTQTNGSAQFVCGQANIREASRSVDDPLKKAFIVGNGVGNDDPALNVYSNAFHVTQGGKAWVQNEMEVDKAGGGVVLKTPDGRRVLLTVDNNLQPKVTLL